MKKSVKPLAAIAAAVGIASCAFAATVDLSSVSSARTFEDDDVVTGTLGSPCKLSIADGATVTLRDVKINADCETTDSTKWSGLTCEGDATIILEGENIVCSFHRDCSGVFVPEDYTLTIQGEGSLTATGGGFGGAGIGSGQVGGRAGDIIIEGGTVHAQGGAFAAGIGSGLNNSCGDITISGGSVTATGSSGGAGIGSGSGSECGDITISGGSVTATGGDNAAGIGIGDDGDGYNVYIESGIVRVVAICGVGFSDPICAGEDCDVIIDTDLDSETSQDGRTLTLRPAAWDLSRLTGDVTITEDMTLYGELGGLYKISIADGVTVTLDGATIAPGSEVADDEACSWAGLTLLGSAEIVLADGSENVVCGFHSHYPGIYVPFGECLTIRGGGSLSASSNGDAAGIGGGYEMACGNIWIGEGNITAVGGAGAAGIGSAYDGSCDTITVVGGVVTATGGSGGAGIGGGEEAEINVIDIQGGSVVAAGGVFAAGVGGGQSGKGFDISITGGTVAASGGSGGAAGIGVGSGGESGTVEITWEIASVTAACQDGAKPIDVGNDDDIDIDGRLLDITSSDGKTRRLVGCEYAPNSEWYDVWAGVCGLSGADAAKDARPAAWGGKWPNAFIYTYGEGLLDGTVRLMTISFDNDGDPVIETPTALPGREGFTLTVLGSSSLDDWSSRVELDEISDGVWMLPDGESANFFRAKLLPETDGSQE